jgi:hypothetical protein
LSQHLQIELNLIETIDLTEGNRYPHEINDESNNSQERVLMAVIYKLRLQEINLLNAFEDQSNTKELTSFLNRKISATILQTIWRDRQRRLKYVEDFPDHVNTNDTKGNYEVSLFRLEEEEKADRLVHGHLTKMIKRHDWEN